MPACTTCKKSPPEVNIKNCAKCTITPYCSRDCQKADWKAHRTICGKQNTGGARQSGGSSSIPVQHGAPQHGNDPVSRGALAAVISNPFTRLDNGTWLHDRPEKDVFRLLIDVYRMRTEDDYKFDGNADVDSIYGGASDGGVNGFRRFLAEVEKKPSLLPAWWNVEKKEECVRFGQGGDSWARLDCAIEKLDVQEHYGEDRFPMQLRMFGETVYGRGPGGSDGTSMRKMMASMEGGGVESPFGSDGGVVSMMDISKMFGH